MADALDSLGDAVSHLKLAEPGAAPPAPSGRAAPRRKWRVTVLISGSGSNLQALLDSLPTSLSTASIVSVLSNKPTAFGLTRAATHVPPVPTTSLSLKQFCDQTPAHPFISAKTPTPSDSVAAKKLAEARESARAAYLLEFAKRVRETRPDLIVLAGWMLILSPEALDALTHDWEEGVGEAKVALETEGASPYPAPLARGTPIPIINLHPALPDTFPGAHAIDDAYKAFQAGKIDKTGIMIHRVIPELDAGAPVVVREIPMREGESQEELETRIHIVEHEAIVEAVAKVLNGLEDGSWWNAS